MLTGVSAVFGEDVWSVKGKSIDKVRSLVRCRCAADALVPLTNAFFNRLVGPGAPFPPCATYTAHLGRLR